MFVAPVVAWGLAADEAPMSVTLTMRPPVLNVPETGEVIVRNLDDRAVAAFVVVVRVAGPDGKTAGSERIVVTSNAIVPGVKNAALAKGKEWRGKTAERKPVTGAALNDRIEASLDYVLFTNGDRWGPDRTKASQYIEGLKQGAAAQLRASHAGK
jgi:hypothetical protein